MLFKKRGEKHIKYMLLSNKKVMKLLKKLSLTEQI